jgi:hypothetical protein
MVKNGKGMIVMKKYIIGTLFGFALAFSITAHGEAINLIDKVVQGMFPVTVDGVSMGDAIVVENKTYLPVREFGEAIGYKVSFTDDREVILTKNEPVPTVTPSAAATNQPIPIVTPAVDKVQEAFKTLVSYDKAIFKIDNEYKKEVSFGAVTIDGNIYVQPVLLSDFIKGFNDPVMTVNINKDVPINITIESSYSKNCDAFKYKHVSYVNLSALGLKATTADGTLIIEKQ